MDGRTSVETLRSDVRRVVVEAIHALRNSWTNRRECAWLALIAVPLAMNASGLLQLWWLWLPLTVGAGACTPVWRWTWVVTLQLAILGTEWAFVGAAALTAWPTHRDVVGVVWVGTAIALAAAGFVNRRFNESPARRHPR